eukprot:842747-Amphidinium_carterae.1
MSRLVATQQVPGHGWQWRVSPCYGQVPLALAQQQCVGDAEAMAVAMALWLCPGEVHVYTDCAEVYNACNGQGRCSKVRGHWWDWIARYGAGRLRVSKVKAHALAPQRDDVEAWQCWQGNALADEYARKGARRHPEVKGANGEKGEVVASHLMALASWVGRQARALIQGEVKDCDDLQLDGGMRSPEVQAPAGRRRWVPPE